MILDNAFVLPTRNKAEVKVRVLSNRPEEKDELVSMIREVANPKGSVLRIKPDTKTTVKEDVVYVKSNNLGSELYPEDFTRNAISISEFIYKAYEGGLK